MALLQVAVYTDYGIAREHSRYSAYADPMHNFFIVADAMYGRPVHEQASAMAVDIVREELAAGRHHFEAVVELPNDANRKAMFQLLEKSIKIAHRKIVAFGARGHGYPGIGTSLDVMLVAGQEAFLAHVGDTRTYLLRKGSAALLTTDHTVAEIMIMEGKMSLEESKTSPLKNVLVNAVGAAEDVGIELAHVELRAGDRLLLCSPTLHGYFTQEHELLTHTRGRDPESAIHELASIAMGRGCARKIKGIWIDFGVNYASSFQRSSRDKAASAEADLYKQLCDKTVLVTDDSHGNQVAYLSREGHAYLWYPGNDRVVQGNWQVRRSDFGMIMCFQYGENTYNPVTGETGSSPSYLLLDDWISSITDCVEHDIFGLMSENVPALLPKTPLFSSLSELAAKMEA